MNYYEAAKIRKKGFADLMTDKLTSGQGVFSSARSALSDRSKARSLGLKEKFDPLNIAKVLTGGSNLAPAMLGRLLGRSASDIKYFTGKREYTPRSESSYFNNYTPPSMSPGGSRKATRVLEKMLSFMEKSRADDMQEQDTLDSFNELNENMREDRHKEVMNVFIEATKAKRKAEKDMAREAKKRERAAKKKEPEVKKEIPKPEPKKEAPPAKTEAPPPKAETPKTQPKTEAPPTAKPVETAPSAPTAAPAPPVTTPKLPMVKPAVTEAAKSAAKVGVAGAAGISASAALSIERETGKPAKDAIKNVGQIVPNDPKPGVSSYGVFGINSGGSVQSFVKDNPQFELNSKPASKEFDEQWSKISKERPQEMLNAQLRWYEKNITNPLKKDLTKIVPTEFANDPRVLTYMSDRRVQYGKTMESQALKQASSAKTVEEFLSLMSQYDLANLKDAFKTYLSNHPNAIKGLEKRIREREKASLKVVENNSNLGEKLNSDSTQNTDMKKDMSQGSAGGSPVIIQNNNTTQAKTNIHRAAPQEELNPTMR
jgi:hypothetical protein